MDEKTIKKAFTNAKGLSGVNAELSIVPDSDVKEEFKNSIQDDVKLYCNSLKERVYVNDCVLGTAFSEDSMVYAMLHELSHVKNNDRGFSIKMEQRCFREAYEWLEKEYGESEALKIVDRHIEEFAYLYGHKKHPFFEDQTDNYLPFLKDKLPSYRENSILRKIKKTLSRSL